MEKNEMYCYQCEETANNMHCNKRGVCGKSAEVSNLQDLLIYVLKGISYYLQHLRKYNISDEAADVIIIKGLFATITNANFDKDYFISKIQESIKVRDSLRIKFLKEYKKNESMEFKENFPACAIDDITDFDKKTLTIGILSTENEDIRSLRWTLIYGLKGISAYAYHAFVLGYKDDKIFDFIEKGLYSTEDNSLKLEDYVNLILKCGEFGFKIMKLLDKANTEKYRHPEPTKINIGVKNNPGILISGHDLHDLEELLKQTKDTGIDVYTHGEMLPANAYPLFKEYKNLVGNYGGSWWHQIKEFDSFNGPVILTTNCLVPPKESYKDRIYVTGIVGFPGLKQIPLKGSVKDFSGIIKHAKKCKPPQKLEEGFVNSGFAHNSLLMNAGKVIELIKEGKIKKFFVMAGCDGRQTEREYYTKFVKNLPSDVIILTAGCAKFRYNKLNLGDIEGIPRILDAGQCNDCYSLMTVAIKLKEAFQMNNINELPIVFNISWYEQKAVLILLTLLHAGIKDITLGPRLPAFLSENVLKLITSTFSLKNNSIVEEDMPKMIGNEIKSQEIIVKEIFYKISSGMYAVSSSFNGKESSFIANTVFQVTSKPPVIAISVAKKNLTHKLIENSKVFTISILSEEAPLKLIGALGFKSGLDNDKLRLLKVKTGVTGAPIVMDNSIGYLEVELMNSVDLDTHTLFIGKVISSKLYNHESIMTYEYYQKEKNGKCPETCPTFIQSADEKDSSPIIRDMSKYECIPCGYIYDPVEGDPDSGIAPGTHFIDIPEDWECPVCGVKKTDFVRFKE